MAQKETAAPGGSGSGGGVVDWRRDPENTQSGAPAPAQSDLRAVRLIRALAALAQRFERGIVITSEEMGLSPQAVVELVQLEIAVRDGRTPEDAARAEAEALS